MTRAEKNIKAHTRRLANGKTVMVRQHKATYEAADLVAQNIGKKGAGNELAQKKADKEYIDKMSELPFSQEEFAEWYNWDTEDDPNNKTAKAVEKHLKKILGRAGYKEFYDKLTDSWTPRGAKKAFKELKTDFDKQAEAKKSIYEHSRKDKDTEAESDASSKKGAKADKIVSEGGNKNTPKATNGKDKADKPSEKTAGERIKEIEANGGKTWHTERQRIFG